MDLHAAIQAIKEKIPLSALVGRYVELRHQGNRLSGPCPFHQETKPSFFVNDDRGSFHCFGCQASGDLIEFHMRVTGATFHEAVVELAREAGIDLDNLKEDSRKTQLRANARLLHQEAAGYYATCLSGPSGRECREYLDRRGISPEIMEKFGLGWAERSWNSLQKFLQARRHDPECAREAGLLGRSERGTLYDRFRGRLMFPIRDMGNQVIAFGGRIIANEEEAKYINSADTPIYNKKEHLYGLVQARRAIVAKGHALLTEGYMDVLTLHQFGFDNSAGVLGTALTPQQIQRLCGFASNVVLVFDGDRAGRAAALRSSQMFLVRGIGCKVVSLPEGEDIDSFLRKAGTTGFEKLVQTATNGLDYCLEVVKTFAPKEAIAWAKNYIAEMQLPELASPHASIIAGRLGISEDHFRQGLPTPMYAGRNDGAMGNLCERDTQIMLFAVRYPGHLDALREIGADLALTSPRSKLFWELLDKHGENAIYYLDEKQKTFWHGQRGPEAPPCNNPELELQCLKESLDRFYARSQLAALSSAMQGRAGNDFDLDVQYLQAVQNTMRKDDEQSEEHSTISNADRQGPGDRIPDL